MVSYVKAPVPWAQASQSSKRDSHKPSHLVISSRSLILKSPLSLDSWRVSSSTLIRVLTQAPALLEEGLRCCLGGERGITHFAWISWWCRLDQGKRLGCLGYSEREVGRHSRDATSHVRKRKKGLSEVGQVLQERFATGNERDLRKSFSGSRTSARAITPALIVKSLYWKLCGGYAGFYVFSWKWVSFVHTNMLRL